MVASAGALSPGLAVFRSLHRPSLAAEQFAGRMAGNLAGGHLKLVTGWQHRSSWSGRFIARPWQVDEYRWQRRGAARTWSQQPFEDQQALAQQLNAIRPSAEVLASPPRCTAWSMRRTRPEDRVQTRKRVLVVSTRCPALLTPRGQCRPAAQPRGHGANHPWPPWVIPNARCIGLAQRMNTQRMCWWFTSRHTHKTSVGGVHELLVEPWSHAHTQTAQTATG
jgi:hypothetical protein